MGMQRVIGEYDPEFPGTLLRRRASSEEKGTVSIGIQESKEIPACGRQASTAGMRSTAGLRPG
jgi:hypothetical protein